MILAFSIQPTGRPHDAELAARLDTGADGAGVHEAVAAAVAVVRASGLPHHTSSMFTEIEGEWDEVFAVLKRATEAVEPYGSRISLVVKADIRPGYEGQLQEKVERLERSLTAQDG